MTSPISLNAAGEKVWTRFQRGLRWKQGFALILLFTNHHQVAEVFRQRLAGIYQARISGLRLLRHTPQQPDDLSAALLPQLLRPHTVHGAHSAAPLWVELNHGLSSAWEQARHKLFARLNEHRAVLIRQHHWPVIIVLPAASAPNIPFYAPDLWAIRQQSLTLDNWLPTQTAMPAKAQAPAEIPTPQARPLTTVEQAKLDEWSRIKDLTPPDPGMIRAGWAASEVCQQHGRWQQKAHIDQAVLVLARHLAAHSVGAQRDLAISLSNLGNVHRVLGHLDQARKAHEEALNLCRRRLQQLGETPETLRDLSVSLNTLGNIHRTLGHLDQARKIYEEALHLRRLRLQRIGETPEALRDLSISLNNLGNVHKTLGHLDQAREAHEEALNLRRRRLQQLGETPEALRDLSVSLNNLGNIHEALGHSDQARKAYEQGLHIAATLADNAPDLPDIAALVVRFRQRLNSLGDAPATQIDH